MTCTSMLQWHLYFSEIFDTDEDQSPCLKKKNNRLNYWALLACPFAHSICWTAFLWRIYRKHETAHDSDFVAMLNRIKLGGTRQKDRDLILTGLITLN